MRSIGRACCCGLLGRIRASLGARVAPSTCPPLTLSGNLIGRPGGGPWARTRQNPQEPSEAQQPRQSRLRDDACKSSTDGAKHVVQTTHNPLDRPPGEEKTPRDK